MRAGEIIDRDFLSSPSLYRGMALTAVYHNLLRMRAET
jgi:hypothetical protein